jgi:hypothetical protein
VSIPVGNTASDAEQRRADGEYGFAYPGDAVEVCRRFFAGDDQERRI